MIYPNIFNRFGNAANGFGSFSGCDVEIWWIWWRDVERCGEMWRACPESTLSTHWQLKINFVRGGLVQPEPQISYHSPSFTIIHHHSHGHNLGSVWKCHVLKTNMEWYRLGVGKWGFGSEAGARIWLGARRRPRNETLFLLYHVSGVTAWAFFL